MPQTIDYYFAGASPFTYLGHQAICDLAERHGATLVFRPVNIKTIWDVSGAVPPAQRPPIRQRYRLIELQRIAHMRDLPINLKPKHFPVDTTLADCCCIAIAGRNRSPAGFLREVLQGVWVDDADMADERAIADRLAASDFDPDTILAIARKPETIAQREAYSKEAVEHDAVGVPAYVLNGEVFWGQDRIAFLEQALETGRAPFKAE